ncbi:MULTISPECIES: universal stress protein [Comamonadaceae]|uniref:universal stress protein n=1 Tax=Comamonadaceae TaxID=80864 RepID=UPI001B37FEA2|nr:universal stress protein [Comamonas aquatica]QTX22546.1 universal stress protein [Comamonas aquatica]
MATLLLPCDGTASALLAVRHVISAYSCGEVRMIHLLNVQPPFSPNVVRHISRDQCAEFQQERADEALAVARQLLDTAGVPYRAHLEIGDKAHCIAAAARHLCCHRIVIGTARKSAFVRAVQNSLTSQLMENCTVPVEVISGAPAGLLERVGIPASVGTGMALAWVGES